MASLESRSGNFRVVFRLDGQKFSCSLATKDPRKAKVQFAQLEEKISRYEIGRLAIPAGCDPAAYLLNGSAQTKSTASKKGRRNSVTIKQAWQVFQDSLPQDSLEQSTLGGIDHPPSLVPG